MAVLVLLGISWGKFIKRECIQDEYRVGVSSIMQNAFWGDSSAVFVAKELQNGYRISIISNMEICLFHFERGDSISRYFAIHELPFECRHFEDSVGVFAIDIKFPVCKLDTLDGNCPPMFFMDVNFDGEEEFIVSHQGYNREYYASFDLVKGNDNGSCPGLLEANNEPPYNNLVGGGFAHNYTAFDYKNKEIYIYESLGCSEHQEIWAKYQNGNEYGFGSGVKVEKKVHYQFSGVDENSKEIVTTYKMVNDTLKIVNVEEIPFYIVYFQS
jgi:hypothetical protein